MNLSISISQNSFHSSSYSKLCFSNFKLLMAPCLKGFCYGSAGKESACSERDLGSIPGLGRSPGEGKGYPLQYSGLENPMDCIVHGVTNSQTRLSDFHFASLHKTHFSSYVILLGLKCPFFSW